LRALSLMHCVSAVPRLAFGPPPAVRSAVVRLLPLPASRRRPVSWSAFEMVVTQAFSQRRKMLRRALAQWAPHISWQALGIVETARAQDLSVEQFIALSDFLVDKQVLPGS